MRSSFAVFCPDFKSASQLREKAEGSSISENRFDRVSNGIVDALKDFEHTLEMGVDKTCRSVAELVYAIQEPIGSSWVPKEVAQGIHKLNFQKIGDKDHIAICTDISSESMKLGGLIARICRMTIKDNNEERASTFQ
ncbi:hypothetical protein V6N11_067166 [Hibiscus sabdariffa]|uniref:Uncharacterized protein n=1 Tax=Hibiscus sabdariffa TaxID=183260 RepID=A0ABR2SPW3_9ROSI